MNKIQIPGYLGRLKVEKERRWRRERRMGKEKRNEEQGEICAVNFT